MLLVEDIIELLQPHVEVSGWQLEVGIMPPRPDRVIMIGEAGGTAPNPRYLIDYPSITVLVRGEVNGYLAARAEIQAVKDLLLGVDPRDWPNGDRWVSVVMPSDIAFIGNDENQRPTFTSNYNFIIEPAASAETSREPL